MAKCAVENGVSKAAKDFSKQLGKNIHESSIRTIKKAYLLKKATKDDFSKGLECDKRGKPVMLGKIVLGKTCYFGVHYPVVFYRPRSFTRVVRTRFTPNSFFLKGGISRISRILRITGQTAKACATI